VLEAILGTRNLKVPNREVLTAAVEIYGSGGLGFPDAYHIAWMRAKGQRRVATFERKNYKEGEGLEFLWQGY
jgi:predicted nucleic acid-binding protein